jgi:hypothetical protein
LHRTTLLLMTRAIGFDAGRLNLRVTTWLEIGSLKKLANEVRDLPPIGLLWSVLLIAKGVMRWSESQSSAGGHRRPTAA